MANAIQQGQWLRSCKNRGPKSAMITAAGGRNVRTEASWQVLPLERLIETPPALIALGFFDSGRDRINAWSPSRHPALRRALANARTVNLPPAAAAGSTGGARDEE